MKNTNSETRTNEYDRFVAFLDDRGFRFSYQPSDFLYDRKGLWPQPAIDHPLGEAPEVLGIPQQEWDDWEKYVGSFYTNNLLKFAAEAIWFAFEKKHYAKIDNQKFASLLSEGLYSKFLVSLAQNKQDPVRQIFSKFIQDEETYEYFKSDFSCMQVVTPFEGTYVASSIALLRRPHHAPYDYEIIAVLINHREMVQDKKLTIQGGIVLSPNDGYAWDLSKYFVLQGAAHRINLIDHAKVHFPNDAINAITKTVLPKTNLVYQLLIPHLWLSLPVNNTVLEGDRSLINRTIRYPWSPLTGMGESVRRLIPFGWYGAGFYEESYGVKNNSYPRYRFCLHPEENLDSYYDYSRYGACLKRYFETIKNFVKQVVRYIPSEGKEGDEDPQWYAIREWAFYISQYLPGFPNWEKIAERDANGDHDVLASTIAMVIWNVSVLHSADHEAIHNMQMENLPFVLRVPPPTAEGVFSFDLNRLCHPTDLIPSKLVDLMFYKPHNNSLLVDVDYQWQTQKPDVTEALKQLTFNFRQSLHTTASQLKQEGLDVINLHLISASLQY